MDKVITVGSTLYGYCNGYFGRDSYGDKRVIAMGKEDGVNWIVVKEGHHILFASGFSKKDLTEWGREDDYE